MKRLIIFLSVILMVFLLAGAVSATGSPTLAYTPAVSTDNSAIDGHKMVYEKKSTVNNKNIYITDLSSGSSKAVSTSSYDEENPDISGNIVVWQKMDSTGHWQIYKKDISTNNAASLVHAVAKDQMNPSISGNYVVWQQYFGSGSESNGYAWNYDIVGYNLATHKYYPHIADSSLEQLNPDISGNTVVYEQWTNVGTTASPNWKMQVYKTTFGSTNAGTKIYASSNKQYSPVVSRTGRAAWQEWFGDAYKYDIVWVNNVWSPTTRNFMITADDDINPAIYANMLVWRQQYGSGSVDYDIYMQNLGTTGLALTKTAVAMSGINEFDPAVGGDSTGIYVAYTNMEYGYDRVFYRNMAKPPKVTALTPARDSVNVALNQNVIVYFGEAIQSSTMHIELYEAATKTQVAILSKPIVGNILTITHALLKKATKYTITLFEGSVTDLIGNRIAIFSRSFTTVAT